MKWMVLAVALVASPVQAQSVSVNVDRFNTLVKVAPTLCRTAREMGGAMLDNIDKLMAPISPTSSERVIMLAMCKTYLHGLVDASEGNL